MARNIASSILICCVVAACALPSFAGARFAEPRQFNPATDGDLVQVVHPVNGSTIAAWTYRNGSETDIAISVLDTRGRWSDPRFVGQHDGIDQERPALTTDVAGSLYLAFSERQSGLVRIAALAAGAELWTPAEAVSSRGKVSERPSLSVVGNRVVLAYLADGAVRIRSFFRISPVIPMGINMTDGPDPHFGDRQPFPTEEDSRRDGRTTMDEPDSFVELDASGLGKPPIN